jgi:hypothetical protein
MPVSPPSRLLQIALSISHQTSLIGRLTGGSLRREGLSYLLQSIVVTFLYCTIKHCSLMRTLRSPLLLPTFHTIATGSQLLASVVLVSSRLSPRLLVDNRASAHLAPY